MVEFIFVLFVLSFFFFFFPRSFSQFLRLPFFLPLSWCLAFLNSLSKFLHLLVHIVGDRFLSSLMKSTPTSACLTSAWTHVLALVLDPCLDSLLGALTSTSTSWSSSLPLLSPRIICWYWWWEWAWVWGWGWGAWWGGKTPTPTPSCGFLGRSKTPLPPHFLISLSLYLGWVCCISFAFFINLKRDNMGFWKEIF